MPPKTNSSKAKYLLDVNVLIALLSEDHVRHEVVMTWFSTRGLLWAICALSEGGFLRNATAPRPGQITMDEATALLKEIKQHPGYSYLAITVDWETLSSPFSQRLYGTKQVTDAYLLGLAIQNNLVLVTMDKAILHLAGPEYKNHVLILAS